VARYIIGIDLGTTNCGLAWAEAQETAHETPEVHPFPVAQLVNPGDVREEPLLPSFLYVPGPADFPDGTLELPWGEPAFIAGTLAQKRGSEAPARLISSAKSWLSWAGVARNSAFLPLNAAEGTEKLSPVSVSREYLNHLRQAWNHEHGDDPLEDQMVLVTVPASFDAVARELTLQAAAEAGYREPTLLEEPQAAFYAWIERHPDWRGRVTVGDLILVADIGGGTTDFTLIAVTEQNGELQLERVAVGEHILLGGDNIDLALARSVEQQLAAKGQKLDTLQLYGLWQQCRIAKEKLLEEGSKAKEHPVTIAGRGTKLVGGTIRATLERNVLDRILLDGFLPVVSSEDMPARRPRAALAELGLPYTTDTAITRHLAHFLRQRAAAAEHGTVRRGKSGLVCPTHILFNGGVLRAAPVRQRILEVLNGWLKAERMEPVKPLLGDDLMHAVSRGAAYYGLTREGKGVRIRGGVPRTYYVGIESAMPAVPGIAAPLKALTVVPFGMEEGTSASIPQREFALIVGEPAEFRFFQSAARRDDSAGTLIEDPGADLTELSPVQVNLPADGNAGQFVPVTLESVVTETGLLQLWCVARDGRRWKLEFNVRETVSP
jgi:hypothetical protein